MRVLVPYDITPAQLVSSSLPLDDAPVWDGEALYLLGQRVVWANRIWERAVAGSSPTAPQLDPAHWIDAGPTNRWAMFDRSGDTASRSAGAISVTLALGGPVGDVALLGVVGTSVTVAGRTVAVPAAGEEGATLLLAGLGASGTITLSINGGPTACAAVCAGTFATVGDVCRNAAISGTDHSSRTADDFGQITTVRRGSSRRVTVPFEVPAAGMDQAARILTACNSRLALWDSIPGLDAGVVYGLAGAWTLTRQRADMALGSVTLDAITLGEA